MNIQQVMYIVIGAIVGVYLVATLVILISRRKAKRFDGSSFPRGNQETDFSRRMSRRLQAKDEDEF